MQVLVPVLALRVLLVLLGFLPTPRLGAFLAVVVLGGVVLASDGLGGDVLGVLDVLSWVGGVLFIVPFIALPRSLAVSVLVLVLQVLGIEGIIRHVKRVPWGTIFTCALH